MLSGMESRLQNKAAVCRTTSMHALCSMSAYCQVLRMENGDKGKVVQRYSGVGGGIQHGIYLRQRSSDMQKH